MKLKLSKNLTAGCLVQRIGNKINCLGKNRNPDGVYYPLPTIHRVRTLTFDGNFVDSEMDIPAGIRVYGVANVLIKEALK